MRRVKTSGTSPIELSDLPPAALNIFARRQTISNVTLQLAATANETVTVRDLVNHFGERAFGALLLIFAIPNALPMPPGVSLVIGVPLVLITFQLMLGSPRLWLPRTMMDRGVSRATFIAMSLRILPTLRRTELVVKPRFQGLFNPVGDRLLGTAAFVLALASFMPIPFGHLLPALALVAFGFGLIEFDGLAIVVGWLVGVFSIGVLTLLSHSLIQGANHLLAMGH